MSITPIPDTTDSHQLALEHIEFAYEHAAGSRIQVLRDLSLTAEPGQVVVVAGRSGSGKTTLLKIACGLMRPDKGKIRWGDLDIGSLDDDGAAQWRRSQVGIMPQGGGLIDFLTASENISMASFGAAHSGNVSRVKELLGDVGLVERSRHMPAELSAGEQQRVALARALYNHPRLLVADEPTANLDRSNADAVVQLLIGLKQVGRSILVASHDPALIESGDYVLELD